MSTQEVTIDLDKARSSKAAKVFSGRDRGTFWRKQFKLDELDRSDSTVVIKVPDDILSINLSFFLSLFGESVRALGRHGFQAKYRFEADESLTPLIQQGVDQALKRSSALPKIA